MKIKWKILYTVLCKLKFKCLKKSGAIKNLKHITRNSFDLFNIYVNMLHIFITLHIYVWSQYIFVIPCSSELQIILDHSLPSLWPEGADTHERQSHIKTCEEKGRQEGTTMSFPILCNYLWKSCAHSPWSFQNCTFHSIYVF